MPWSSPGTKPAGTILLMKKIPTMKLMITATVKVRVAESRRIRRAAAADGIHHDQERARHQPILFITKGGSTDGSAPIR